MISPEAHGLARNADFVRDLPVVFAVKNELNGFVLIRWHCILMLSVERFLELFIMISPETYGLARNAEFDCDFKVAHAVKNKLNGFVLILGKWIFMLTFRVIRLLEFGVFGFESFERLPKEFAVIVRRIRPFQQVAFVKVKTGLDRLVCKAL